MVQTDHGRNDQHTVRTTNSKRYKKSCDCSHYCYATNM